MLHTEMESLVEEGFGLGSLDLVKDNINATVYKHFRLSYIKNFLFEHDCTSSAQSEFHKGPCVTAGLNSRLNIKHSSLGHSRGAEGTVPTCQYCQDNHPELVQHLCCG